MERIARRSPARSFNSDEDLNAYPNRDGVFGYGVGRAGSPYRSPARSARGGVLGSSSPLMDGATRTESPRSLREESVWEGPAHRSGRRGVNGLRQGADPLYENENQIRRGIEYGSHYEDSYGREAMEPYGGDGTAPKGYRDGRIGGGYMGGSARSRERQYTDQGPSYHRPNELYDMGQAELLNKGAEYEYQKQIHRMSYSSQPARRGQGTAYPQGYDRADDSYAEDHFVRERGTRRVPLTQDDEPMYPSGGHAHAAYNSGRNMEYANSYARHPPATRQNEILYYDDPSLMQMPRRPHYQREHPQQRPVDDYARRKFVEYNQDSDEESALSKDRHHPNCVCSRCHHASDVQDYDHAKAVPGDVERRRGFPSVQTEPTTMSPGPGHIQQFANPAPNTRGSSLAVSDDIGSSHPHPPPMRALVTNKESRICHPIAGGAPFIVCSHCSELLKLPKKVKEVKQSRMKCGACSTILVFDLENKKPHASVPSQSNPSSGSTRNIRSKGAQLYESVEEKAIESSIAKTLSSETLDSTGYTYKSTDSSEPLEHHRISFIEADKNPGILSPHSSHASKEGYDSDSISDKPVNAPFSPHGDYYNLLAVARTAMGARDRGEETAADEEGTMSLNSVGSRAPATEIDINTEEMPKTDQSQGSTGGTPSGKDRERNKKEAGWLQGLMGKGPKNSASVSSSMSSSIPRTDVFVNGQPILHRAVKRAEKLAGPISPGVYWYDSRAGFWGVVGSYGLGIIPPYIQEFGFPMQADCSGGNTLVYVNGRELHEIDLNMLSRRGLPRTENMYYALDITGRVEIEDTGEFVADLKRLAPSVEKNKCGFGMKPLDT